MYGDYYSQCKRLKLRREKYINKILRCNKKDVQEKNKKQNATFNNIKYLKLLPNVIVLNIKSNYFFIEYKITKIND